MPMHNGDIMCMPQLSDRIERLEAEHLSSQGEGRQPPPGRCYDRTALEAVCAMQEVHMTRQSQQLRQLQRRSIQCMPPSKTLASQAVERKTLLLDFAVR